MTHAKMREVASKDHADALRRWAAALDRAPSLPTVIRGQREHWRGILDRRTAMGMFATPTPTYIDRRFEIRAVRSGVDYANAEVPIKSSQATAFLESGFEVRVFGVDESIPCLGSLLREARASARCVQDWDCSLIFSPRRTWEAPLRPAIEADFSVVQVEGASDWAVDPGDGGEAIALSLEDGDALYVPAGWACTMLRTSEALVVSIARQHLSELRILERALCTRLGTKELVEVLGKARSTPLVPTERFRSLLEALRSVTAEDLVAARDVPIAAPRHGGAFGVPWQARLGG
jgi:hypothetical protein